MNQFTWAAQRRARDSVFVERYFAGEGIDIGTQQGQLHSHVHLFPQVTRLLWWNSALGGVAQMHGIGDASLDFVHAGNGLANEANPAQALARWLELLKPGGFAIVTVPDEDLYEKGTWPSRFNSCHRSSFTICKPEKALPNSYNVLDIVQALAPVADCERLMVIRDNYDAQRPDIDQTAHGHAECVIELVLRKRAVPEADHFKQRVLQAPTAEDAWRESQTAMRVYPYRFDIYHIALQVMLHWERLEEADAVVNACIARLFDGHLPRLTQALHAIASGKLHEGFRLREAFIAPLGNQRRTKALPPDTYPAWRGEPLEGKRIVIWSEFGLGDEIFFFRFARILRERCGARSVSVLCQSPLAELFDASGEAAAVIDIKHAATMPEHDYWVFPHAIMAHLPLDLDALPLSVPYLRASPGALPGRPHAGALKVGFVFKGEPTHENDRERSAPSLSVFDAMFALEGMQFLSVQKGAGADEAAAYAARLPDFFDVGANVTSMSQTASVIAALDVVVAVDTSVAHLAAAMGKPVLMIMPFYGDWRWHYVREDSPWYPTMRLIRRKLGDGWDEAVARVSAELARMRDARRTN